MASVTEPRLSWNQPICDVCFWLRNPNREPVRLREPEAEICAYCGDGTTSGIYVRADPASFNFPTRRKR